MSNRSDTALGLDARKGIAGRVARWALYALVVFVFAGPLVALLLSSFNRVGDPGKFTILPTHPTLANYRAAIDKHGLWMLLRNSLVVAGGGLLLQVTVTVFAAYALARKRFRGAAIVLVLILATLMLPEEILAIPLSLVLGDLPLLHVSITGSLLGMIVPVGAWAVSIVVMTEFMKEIPIELEEAARIDGAGELRVFGSVILPLCRPALGIVGILGFAMIWDQYMLPLLVANDFHQYTLSLALRTLRSDDQVGLGVLLAAAALALLPSVAVFLAFQRQFMKGLTSGAVKG